MAKEESSGKRRNRRMMVTKTPGLHSKWKSVVDSLDEIVPFYEKGSSRISLFSDSVMRQEVAEFVVKTKGQPILDLGAGPGTLSRIAASHGGVPILADASRKMLLEARGFDRVQAVFEYLPFRDGSFSSAMSGFAIRDSIDLRSALSEIRRVVIKGGRLGFCDLGKPPSRAKAWMVGLYLRVAVPIIGLFSGGIRGLKFRSLIGTYRLVVNNRELVKVLKDYFDDVSLTSRQMGAAIVVRCEG